MTIPMNAEAVKRRRYRSDRRQAQAASTRHEVVAAAQRLFERDGYAATTMAAVADEAGVAVETIYRNFEGKAGLIEAVIEAAVAGDAGRAQTAVEDRPAIRSITEEKDPRKKLALYAATQPGIHRRAGRLRRALREAAHADSRLEAVHQRLEDQPYIGLLRFAQHLQEFGALKSGLTVEEARDLLWSINSLAMYELLVVDRGWSTERYEDWITQMMIQSLIGD